MVATETKLKREVMWRVRVIYFLRQLERPIVVEVGLLGGAFGLTLFMVSVKNIYANLSVIGRADALMDYSWSAISHTELAVQGLVVVMAVSGAFLLKDMCVSATRLMKRGVRMYTAARAQTA